MEADLRGRRREELTGATAGSVLFAHYLLAHNIGDHEGAGDQEPRETIYYRLHASGHRDRWRGTAGPPRPPRRTFWQ